ncbi:uncharacterized protein TNIN_474681 [Trichonephila inaurata madagascariensis]|uniref:Uncharacterized protein n=1 Tax=Trichonephila inaurata madagascariensis TaxID=2747483 RepID=A0A8X6XQL5_9ARAC|nr:uncharacterized protein TNIN_474681 [Trichonephila inaurata madagascariensis]
MGKCRSYRPRKRKFHGNQNTCTETASCKEEIMTASSLKLQQYNQVNNDESNISEHLTGNRYLSDRPHRLQIVQSTVSRTMEVPESVQKVPLQKMTR